MLDLHPAHAPEHLQRFPCMYPWIGEHYGKDDTRIAVVCESHFLPFGVTRLNHDAESWYQSRQDMIPATKIVNGIEINVHSYMNTCYCVKNRHASGNKTYSRIEQLFSFSDIALFNYVFRPSEESEEGKSRGYSHPYWNLVDADQNVSESILRWFIAAYKQIAIIFASGIVKNCTNAHQVMQEFQEVARCMTHHPTQVRFLDDARKFLSHESECC